MKWLSISLIAISISLCVFFYKPTGFKVDYWIPKAKIPEYYISLNSGNLSIGDEFDNKAGLYEEIERTPEYTVYKQPLGMYDLTVSNNRIVSIRSASKDTILCSCLYTGMTEMELSTFLKNTIVLELKDRKIFIDQNNDVGVEVSFDKLTGKSDTIRISCIRLEDI